MGCSNSKDETNETNITLPAFNTDVQEEQQIRILSEMLVNENKGDFRNFYKVEETLGEGSYGKVYKVKQRITNKTYAMKLIRKDIETEESNKNFLNEIYILRKLDHPNILKIFEFFSDQKYWYFIMDYLPEGDLYTEITKMEYYDDYLTAKIMKQIFSCISYLNKLKIVHRDLKPENMMVASKSEDDISIKLIDFGTACHINKNNLLHNVVGTTFYIAPEVLNGNYGIECDMWSAGVILYILLCGDPPFYGKTDEEVMKLILNSEPDYVNGEWQYVSEEAKDLTKKLLEKNVKKRITPSQALKHPFITKTLRIDKKDDKNINKHDKISLQNHLRNFNSKQKLKQAAVAFIVHQLGNSKKVEKLKKIFEEIDESGEGLLSKEELKKGYVKFFSDNLSEREFDEIMKNIDQDGSGEISIEEFLRATLDYENIATEKHLKLAFEYFDKDKSGNLSPDEIRDVLGLTGNKKKAEKLINDIIKEIDSDGDGLVSFEEFKKMMKNNKEILANNDN